MKIGDKIENVNSGVTGVLYGDGLLGGNFYIRTVSDLIPVQKDHLYLNWIVVEKCDESKPIRTICMFSRGD